MEMKFAKEKDRRCIKNGMRSVTGVMILIVWCKKQYNLCGV